MLCLLVQLIITYRLQYSYHWWPELQTTMKRDWKSWTRIKDSRDSSLQSKPDSHLGGLSRRPISCFSLKARLSRLDLRPCLEKEKHTSCVFFTFFLTLAILRGKFKSPDLGRLQQLKEQPKLVLPVYMMSMFLWLPSLLFFWWPVSMMWGISTFIKTVLKTSQTLLQFPGA